MSSSPVGPFVPDYFIVGKGFIGRLIVDELRIRGSQSPLELVVHTEATDATKFLGLLAEMLGSGEVLARRSRRHPGELLLDAPSRRAQRHAISGQEARAAVLEIVLTPA